MAQADIFQIHWSIRRGGVVQLDLQNSTIATNLNQINFSLLVEFISWSILPIVADVMLDI